MSEPSSHTAVLDPILEHYRRRPTYLLQMLREAQLVWNHLPPAALTYTASALGLPRSRVEGVASFYSFLHTKPAGRYRVLFSDNITDRMQGNMELDVRTELPHASQAYERFTPEGPVALLPKGEQYALVWTASREHAERIAQLPDAEFLVALARHFGGRQGRFLDASPRKTFPLKLAYTGSEGPTAWCASAMPRRRCIRSRGRGSTSACATPGNWLHYAATRRMH